MDGIKERKKKQKKRYVGEKDEGERHEKSYKTANGNKAKRESENGEGQKRLRGEEAGEGKCRKTVCQTFPFRQT